MKRLFDLLTCRFIVNRWKTPMGRQVRAQIIAAAKAGKDLDLILSQHVLEHPAIIEPYDYPFYPPDAMEDKEFWLLTPHDLRGIRFSGEDFSATMSFARRNLGYALFSDCDLSNIDFEMASFNHAKFERCRLANAIFAYATAVDTEFIDCSMQGACMLSCYFKEVELSGSDMRRVYFEDNEFQKLSVNYLTKFDKSLQARWHERSVPTRQLADVYHAIRLAYEKAGLYSQSDHYLMKEHVANRRYILSPRFREERSLYRSYVWFRDLCWSVIAGYGTKPQRTVLFGLFMSLGYALLYYLLGNPPEVNGRRSGWWGSVYFSLTTFATLGYGDLTYPYNRTIMRLLSTSEAILGAVLMALFVVVIARKIIR